MVAGSNVLMQQFYQITQSKGENVGNFAAHVDVALDEIRVQFPNLINEAEKRCLLKDHYFYGMSKSERQVFATCITMKQ